MISWPVRATDASPRATSRPLRVLVVTSAWGPAEERGWLLEFLDGTERLAPAVVTVGHEPLRELLEHRDVPVETHPGPTSASGHLIAAARLHRVLRRLDPDVVVADGDLAAAVSIPAANLTGYTVVRAEHRTGHEGPASGHRAASRGHIFRPAQLRGTSNWPGQLASALAVLVGRAGAGIDPETAPDVSLVVPVWNEGALVDDLVDALLPQLRSRDELVLVDDASPDDTAERAERAGARDPRVRAVRRERNGRAGAARNTGVDAARHDHLVFTDAGCHWGPGWLDAMRAAFAEEPAPDLVSGVYRVTRRDPFEAAMAVGCYPDVRDVRRAGPVTVAWSALFGRRFDATRPAGRAVAMTRRAILGAGGWPEGQIAHEDVDLARAIAEQGLRCVMTTDADLLWDQAGPTGTWAMYVRYGRGDALASDRQALARDAMRAGAYVIGPAGLLRGCAAVRAAVVLGAMAYFSVPLWRALRQERPVVTALLAPAVIALKDVAKAWGAVQVLAERRSSARATPPDAVRPD